MFHVILALVFVGFFQLITGIGIKDGEIYPNSIQIVVSTTGGYLEKRPES